MAEDLHISDNLNRREKYEELAPQLKGLLKGETDLIANLANFTAALKDTFGFLWIGFYLVKDKELVLGPFQGPLACTRIGFGKGVCGTAWKEKKTIIVPDVVKYPGHIACSSKSKSEIVVPLLNSIGEVWAVLDLDSENLNDFSAIDQQHLESLARELHP
jgi:GAF domain-containing protein